MTWKADENGKCHAGCPAGSDSKRSGYSYCGMVFVLTGDLEAPPNCWHKHGEDCPFATIVSGSPLAAEVERHEALCANATAEVDRMAKRVTDLAARVEVLEGHARGVEPEAGKQEGDQARADHHDYPFLREGDVVLLGGHPVQIGPYHYPSGDWNGAILVKEPVG